MKTNSQLQSYAKLVSIRDALKPITQISWSVKNLEKKFNIDTVDESDYDVLYKMYECFFAEVEHAYKSLSKIVETNKTNKTKNEKESKTIHSN